MCVTALIISSIIALILAASFLLSFSRAVYVATDPQTQSVVVAHEGTDPDKLLSIANDAEFAQVAMNATLFPSAASGFLNLVLRLRCL